MNAIRQLVAVILMIPFAIGISYFLPGDWVEDGVIVLLSFALLAIPVYAVLFIISAIGGAFGGGVRRR